MPEKMHPFLIYGGDLVRVQPTVCAAQWVLREKNEEE